jgi:DNA-binding NtrC family response regulator
MMRVLLVDDDTNFRRSLAIGFEVQGYPVHEVKNGMEALEFLQVNQKSDNRVEAVIVDARMPGLDGFWLADQISLMYPTLRVVILSAHPYPEKLGHYTLLPKPTHISMLIQVLERELCTIGKNGPVSFGNR